MPKWPLYASTFLGILYFLTGIAYILSGLGVIIYLPTSEDLIGSIMLLIVGGVYLAGISSLLEDKREGYGFTLVATTLATVLFALHSIVFGTNLLGSFLQLADWLEWTPIQDLSPGIWLFFIVAILIGYLKATNRLGGERGIFPLED